MKLLLLSLVALIGFVTAAQAEIIWYWDLLELPSGWSAGEYWDFNDTGALLYINDPYPYRIDITTSLVSNDLVIPDSVSGYDLYVTFEHFLDYVGGVYDQPMWTDIEARIICNGITNYAFSYNEYVYAGVHSWDYLKMEDNGLVEFTLPNVQAGDILVIEYYFHTTIYGAIRFTFMDWTITDLQIETSGTALQRSTWGALKSSFLM